MIANHIHDALGQVERMQQVVLERRRFHGYSGTARLACGSLAIIAAAVMSRAWYPRDFWHHIVGWGTVLGIGLAINYGCLLFWFLFDETARRQPMVLKPAIDAVPALAVGAVLSAGLILRGHFDLLFGVWMCLYGLAQVAYRLSLPAGVYWTGLWYITAGGACLLYPHLSFTNPWPMGIVFLVGEWAGGLALYRLKRPRIKGEVSDDT